MRSGSRASRQAIPFSSFEELEIRTADGTSLRALVLEPAGDVALRATVILSHAMFARKTSFGRNDRPGLSDALAHRGFRTVAFDFRGHGDSVMSKDAMAWTYDDLVRIDLPAVVECARARDDGKPVVVVGHSLGGHVALAAQGTQSLGADAIVAVGANVWLRVFESSRLRWTAKQAIARAMLATTRRIGRIPARRLRFGSDDASAAYIDDLLRGMTDDRWRSRDGQHDYLAGLRQVKVPVAAVLGDRDLIMCHPSSGEAFARRCAGRVELFRAPTGHMELVTSDRGWPAVLRAVEWAVRDGVAPQARP